MIDSAQTGRHARSYLFVPATRLDRLKKALNLPADEVIVDLEDAVGANAKLEARENLSKFTSEKPLYVRINAVGTKYFDEDVEFCNETRWVKGIVLPMVSCTEDVETLKRHLRRKLEILALVETPLGIVSVDQIASSGVRRLLFGSADYSSFLMTAPSPELFAYPRSRLVLASAIAGLPAPIDGPTLDIHDMEQFASQLRVARTLGMGGKLCIHPSQLLLVSEVFSPSKSEMEWAQRILDAAIEHDDNVFVIGDEMIDAPVLLRARRILEQ